MRRSLSVVLVLAVAATAVVEAFVRSVGLLNGTSPTCSERCARQARIRWARTQTSRLGHEILTPRQPVAHTHYSPRSSTLRMLEEEGGGLAQQEGYTEVTVREAVEWTMSIDSEFTYIDVRSAEEHEKLATVRGALCIPAFELIKPKAEEKVVGEDKDDTAFAPDYNYEDLDYTVKPDFVDTMKAQFALDAKLLIGCKTSRTAKACQLLVDAGFTEVYNVQSQTFMRTRAPQVWS